MQERAVSVAFICRPKSGAGVPAGKSDHWRRHIDDAIELLAGDFQGFAKS